MIFSGNAIRVELIRDSIANLVFDLQDESINKLSQAVVKQLDEAVTAIEEHESVKALIISSNKDVFIVGADVTEFLGFFEMHEKESVQLLKKGLMIPAYDHCLKCSHSFNLLDARGAISVTERAAYIARVRNLAKKCAKGYLEQREEMGFPLLKNE